MRMKFTDQALRRIKVPCDQRLDVWDASVPGFGIRASGPTQRRPDVQLRFQMMCRTADGVQRRLTHEKPYPLLTLKDARRWASDTLDKVAQGKNPTAEKRTARARAKSDAADTLAAVIDLFERRHLLVKGSARHAANTKANLLNHAVPRLGADTNIRDITRAELIRLGEDVMEHGNSAVRGAGGRKRQLKGGPVMANRVVTALKTLFRFALKRGLITSDPSALIELPGREKAREHTLSDAEITVLWYALVELGHPYGDAMQVMLATGQRRDEVARMRWADLDLAERIWTLPASATKSNRGHVVPLSPLVCDILRAVPRLSNEYVFVAGNSKPIAGWSQARARLEKIIGGKVEHFTRHDLRRTCATNLGRLGTSEFIIGRVLNHVPRGVTGGHYNMYRVPARAAQRAGPLGLIYTIVDAATGCERSAIDAGADVTVTGAKTHGRATIIRVTSHGAAKQQSLARTHVVIPLMLHGRPPRAPKWSAREIDRRILAWRAEAERRGERLSQAAAVRAVWEPHRALASRKEVLAEFVCWSVRAPPVLRPRSADQNRTDFSRRYDYRYCVSPVTPINTRPHHTEPRGIPMDFVQAAQLPIGKQSKPHGTATNDPLLSARAVANQCGSVSLMSLWRWGKDPKVALPPPDVYIYTRRYWYASTIRRWQAERVAKSAAAKN